MWPRLFSAIEGKISVNTENTITETDGTVWDLPYQCTIYDIDRIKGALDKTLSRANLIGLPTDFHQPAWKDVSQLDDFPLGSELQTLSQEYALHKRRQVAITKLCAQRGRVHDEYVLADPDLAADGDSDGDDSEEGDAEEFETTVDGAPDEGDPEDTPPPVVQKRGRGRPRGSIRSTKPTKAAAPKRGGRRTARATSPVVAGPSALGESEAQLSRLWLSSEAVFRGRGRRWNGADAAPSPKRRKPTSGPATPSNKERHRKRTHALCQTHLALPRQDLTEAVTDEVAGLHTDDDGMFFDQNSPQEHSAEDSDQAMSVLPIQQPGSSPLPPSLLSVQHEETLPTIVQCETE